MAPPEKKSVSVDVNEFVRTRDALSSAYMSLSASIDKAVKAYLEHTNVVLAGDGTLNISYLTQPFNELAQNAQHALVQGGAVVAAPIPVAATEEPEEELTKGGKKKRTYKKHDPNAPKRPLTAYFRYLQANRTAIGDEMAAANGGVPLKPGDLAKEATARWNGLPKPEQEPWKADYRKDLKDYITRSNEYKISIGQPIDDPAKIAKKEAAAAKRAAAAEAAATGGAPAAADSSDDSSDESSDEEAAPPPKAPTPKKTPKSAMKKAAVPPTPQFSSINPSGAPTSSAPASSPERKRKAPAASAEGGPKKRGRKSNAEKAAAAAEEAPASSAPAAESSPAAVKKEKKKKSKKADA